MAKDIESSKLSIRFCFEIEPFELETYSFPVDSSDRIRIIEMTSNSTLNDVGLLIGSLLAFNELFLDAQFIDALSKSKELALVGGLSFRQNGLRISSSYCADFQDWIFVVEEIKRRSSPWMGHDPSPWFEFEDDKVIIWSDEDSTENVYSIKFNQQQFTRQIEIAKQELERFHQKVEIWARENYKINPVELTEDIRNYLLLTK